MPPNDIRVAVIGGDGIGPEVTDAAITVADAALRDGETRVEWTRLPWGTAYHLAHGRTMPADGLDQLRRFDAILLGAIGDQRVSDTETLHGLVFPIRQHFDQYVNLRPATLFPGVASPLTGFPPRTIDLLMVRENTEGEYANIGGRMHRGTFYESALQTSLFTRRGCRRIIEMAFSYARARRRHVTSISKGNAQLYAMKLWDEVFAEVAQLNPTVESRTLLVDAAALELVRRPDSFDVIVASNLFGDILSDLAAAVVGGLGLTPSGNLDPSRTAPSMFEPIHGSAPDIAGRGIANPIATLLSIAMLLRQAGADAPAERIERAVRRVLADGRVRTPDLGGSSTTAAMVVALCDALA